ncbi:DNA repair protein rad50, partial [Podila humilis]
MIALPSFAPLLDIADVISRILAESGDSMDIVEGTTSQQRAKQLVQYDHAIKSTLVTALEKHKPLDQASLLEAAFKLKLLSAQNELGTKIEDLKLALFPCLDLMLRCSELDLCDQIAPLNSIEEIFDFQTVENSEHIYNYLESRVQRLTSNMTTVKGKGLTLLRLCNELLRRLSKAKNTVFCGRILMLLSNVFPLGERSGVNLKGDFNLENITPIESEDASVVPDLTPSTTPKPAVESMDVDEDKSKTITPAGKESDFYKEFWSLQKFFCNPALLANSPENMSILRKGIEDTLARFADVVKSQRRRRPSLNNSDSKALEMSIETTDRLTGSKRKHKALGDEPYEPTVHFPKFLTSPQLLKLEIVDPYFRKHILVQFLIIIQYLQNHSPSTKELWATLAIPNKVFQPQWTHEDSDNQWAEKIKPQIYKGLEMAGVDTNDKNFASTVRDMFDHEKDWFKWKAESCQTFEKAPLPKETLEEAEQKRQKLSVPLGAVRQKLGCASLTSLWATVDTMQFDYEEIAHGVFQPLTEPEMYISNVQYLQKKEDIQRKNAPAISEEIEDLDKSRLWRGLRVGLEDYLHIYGAQATNPAYSMKTWAVDVKKDIQEEDAIRANNGIPLPKMDEPVAPPNDEKTAASEEEAVTLEKQTSETAPEKIGGMATDEKAEKADESVDETISSQPTVGDAGTPNVADSAPSQEMNDADIMIRGIRSFEADAGDAATITFYSPLTLITGHNGSGKTTIIECLKYATTGELPPGSKGGAFVNDPKMSDSPSTKAQVRLRFRNVNHQMLSVVRSLSLTAKKTGYTQKTLENVLSTVDPNTGELVSVSSKCAEIDVDVPAHLGVSRAILDNVIFCHQEESNWPLSEPSILKKKFDEIFASTKYTNVLDSIKAIKKERSVELKVLFSNLEYLRQNKERAEKLRQALAANVERSEKSQEKVDQLELDIEKCTDDINRLMAKTREIQAIEAALNTLQLELKSSQANVQDLEGNFSLYSESDAELQEMLFKHDLSVKTADQERSRLERSKQRATSSIANLQASATQNQQMIGQLRALLENNKTKQNERDQFIQELAQQLSIEGFDEQPLLSADVQRFLRKLEALIKQAENDGERLR